MHFGDAVIARVRALGHPLCVGLDPHLRQIPRLFARGSMEIGDPETPAAVEAFLMAVLDRVTDRVAVVKPQIAFFEQLGSAGIAVLERIVARARDDGLLVLLDAKRGDIGSTAAGYAAAYLDPCAPCEVDAITVNPYLGLDGLEPFAESAERYGRGLFVLVKTSNPGSGDLQDRLLGDEKVPVSDTVARLLEPMMSRLSGPATGWSSLGVVVGATYPEQGERLRALLPNALFLIPGYGAQGGSAADAMRSFLSGASGPEGGLVNSARGVIFPEAAAGASHAIAWERAIDAALEATIEDLSR